MNDFGAEPEKLRKNTLNAVKRVVEKNWYVLGDEVQRFEAAWAKKCGVSHAVGVGNGMDAIEIILRSLEIGSGDEVITTPMTAFASALAIYRAGATPKLADIEPTTALISVDSVKRCITKKTKAILLVHIYGQLRNLDAWEKLCDEHGIYLIEDCAQAHSAILGGRVAGNFGIAGAFSFYPTKNLGALGDAGALITSDKGLANIAKRLRNYGQSERYLHSELGLNSRLDEMQAAILSERINWLDEFTSRRQSIASSFFEGIKNPAIKLMAPAEVKGAHAYHLFVINCNEREALQKHLYEQGVQSLIHYPIPIHKQQPCLAIQRDPEGLIFSEYHASTCLSLPCHPYLNNADVEKIIEAVNQFRPS